MPVPQDKGWPARIDVHIEAVTAASLTIAYNIYDPVTGTLCVKASTVLAFFDTGIAGLVRLSTEHRKELASYCTHN